MENTELLLIINALLMSLLGAGLSVICFFLKDVYREHKRLQEKVIALQREVNTHHRLSQVLLRLTQRQSDRNREQIEQLTYRTLITKRFS